MMILTKGGAYVSDAVIAELKAGNVGETLLYSAGGNLLGIVLGEIDLVAARINNPERQYLRAVS